jgi:hypothetical protein
VKSSRGARRSPQRCDARVITVREYTLIVEGELSDELGPTFTGMTATRRGGNTTLVGRVRDQAELPGLLQRVSDLGLTLLTATTKDAHDRGEERRLP